MHTLIWWLYWMQNKRMNGPAGCYCRKNRQRIRKGGGISGDSLGLKASTLRDLTHCSHTLYANTAHGAIIKLNIHCKQISRKKKRQALQAINACKTLRNTETTNPLILSMLLYSNNMEIVQDNKTLDLLPERDIPEEIRKDINTK